MSTKKSVRKPASKKAAPRQSEATSKAKEKQELFCVAYVANGRNATRAAKAAGYSEDTAAQAGYRILQMPAVQERIKQLTDEKIASHQITGDEVMEQLAAIIKLDPRRLVGDDGNPLKLEDLDEMTALAVAGLDISETQVLGDGEAGVKTITYKFKFHDKNSAIEKGMRHFGKLPKDGAIQVKAGNVFISNEIAACA